MVEIVPYMLVILGWLPAQPGEIDLQRPQILFADRVECEKAGSQIARLMTQAAASRSGAIYQHRCIEVPGPDEFQTMMKDRQGISE